MKSAFRNLGILKKQWKFLIMKAESPIDGKTYYIVDKCLPFGAAISCALFQAFSDAHVSKHHVFHLYHATETGCIVGTVHWCPPPGNHRLL